MAKVKKICSKTDKMNDIERNIVATEEKAHIEELFKTFDSNKDGKLSNTELNDVICSCFNIKHETLNDEKLVKMRNKLKKILNLMGIKITEDIDLETFKKIISEVQINSVFEDEDTQVNNIFNYFNTNNDGVLTKNELMVGMSKLEISMSEYDAIEMFDGADTMTKQVFKEKIYPMYIKAINGSGTSNVSKQRKNEK